MPLLSLTLVLLLALATPARAAPARAAPGEWVAPVAGPVVVRRAFAPPSVRWGAGHRGVDLAAPVGAAVRAAGAGVVSYAGVLAGRGVLAVTHGALRTTYEPVRPLVGVGDRVRAGEVVAVLLAGHAPAGPPVLHWGLLRGEAYLDPLSLLRRGPSRLLPVAPAPEAPATPAEVSGPPSGAAARGTAAGAAPVAAPAPSRGPAVPPGTGAAVAAVGAAGALGAAAVAASRRRRAPP